LRDFVRILASLALLLFFFHCSLTLPYLHSFPTRRSSDLSSPADENLDARSRHELLLPGPRRRRARALPRRRRKSPSSSAARAGKDRKSTRLNSSHVAISYAVFCLKKKKNKQYSYNTPTRL